MLSIMKLAFCLAMVAAGLRSQSFDVYSQILNSHLRLLLKNTAGETASPRDRFAQDMMTVANRFNRHPSRAAMAQFSGELMKALAGTDPQPLPLGNVTTQIVARCYRVEAPLPASIRFNGT